MIEIKFPHFGIGIAPNLKGEPRLGLLREHRNFSWHSWHYVLGCAKDVGDVVGP